MKKIHFYLLGAAFVLFQSCSVQQFHVNSMFQDFQDGGRLFGENTQGKVCAKKGTFFIVGINAFGRADPRLMARTINADKYTIETKNNLLSLVLAGLTYGVVTYKRVKVIKRDK
jgi:hypothetical protein